MSSYKFFLIFENDLFRRPHKALSVTPTISAISFRVNPSVAIAFNVAYSLLVHTLLATSHT